MMASVTGLNLVVPMDGSRFGEEALKVAATVAGETGEIRLVHVLPVQSGALSKATSSREEEISLGFRERAKLHQLICDAAKRWETPTRRITCYFPEGDPASEILKFATRMDADMIVMSS